ncbi:tRNA-dihydrouridine synthase, partial [Thamnocephalis sphaerospora]
RYAFYTEMHHARKITRLAQEGGAARLHADLGAPCPRTVVQLGGAEPEWLANAYVALAEAGYAEVNLNLGCPSDSVQAGCFGAVLMKTPERVHDIIRAVDAKRLSVPFTVKCRVGVDELDSDAYLQQFLATITQATSLDHIVIHARKAHLKGLSPKENRTIPPLDYARVYMVKRAFPHLRITLNGGLHTTEEVRAQLLQADGVMVGRKFRDSPMFIQELDRGMLAERLHSV